MNSNVTNVLVPGRETYLRQVLNCDFDPFEYDTAELELDVRSDDPPFFRYFVDPFADSQRHSLFDKLAEDNASLVYAEAGGGKTTLRYALELACRADSIGTLTVALTIGKGLAEEKQSTDLWRELGRAIAVDLFVQVIDNLDAFQIRLDTHMIRMLRGYWITQVPQFLRNVERTFQMCMRDKNMAVSNAWWPIWQRPAVRHTEQTLSRMTFLRQLLAPDVSTNGIAQVMEPGESVRRGLQIACELGFRRVFLLVDVADANKRKKASVESQVRWILSNILSMEVVPPVFPKMFLPVWLKEDVERALHTLEAPLIFDPFSVIMNWRAASLFEKLLANRFRSAGSWVRGFNAIASDEISKILQSAIIDAAQGSPRRLMRLASTLIDAHSGRAPDELSIDTQDWQMMCQHWSYGEPFPPPLL